VAKVVAPKKAALAEAEGEFSALMSGLAAKKAQLAEVEKRLEALNTKLGQMQVGEGDKDVLWMGHGCFEALKLRTYLESLLGSLKGGDSLVALGAWCIEQAWARTATAP
jgi:hypothetical protein